MEVVRVVEEAHDSEIISIAYNKARREIYTSAEGDKVIKAWDMRSGQLIRSQQGHKGMVTSLCFSSPLVKLLFSGSMDNTIGIWTEKGVNLQMMAIGGPVFSLAWDDRRRYLIAGGSSVINIFKVDLAEARKTTQAQRSVASGLKDGNSMAEAPQILRRMFQPLKGPDLCHSDVVKCIIVTDAGKIISGGYDRSICIYEFDKLDKPKEALQRVRKCHTAAIVSMAYDTSNNCILTGSIDGSMKVWSIEGRLLDKFENISDSSVNVAYIASTNLYWASGRMGRLLAYDPRAPCNVTEYVKESNGLDRFKVVTMFAPPGTDLLLGATRKRQLVIWQYNPMVAYRTFKKHEDWVEALVVVHATINDQPCDEIFSAGADGRVLRWQLDEEQNCDIYQCIEEIPLHEKNIYCILYSEHLDCLITGGHDSTIQLYYLGGVVPTFNDVPLPTSFQEHTARVTGLALMKNKHLASISADKTIRLWDLTNMKPVFCMVEAHDTEIQCLEYCEERDELATCGMGNKVKIWDVKKPTHMKLKLKLDHADKADIEDSDKDSKKKTNMQWLTRSDMPNLPKASTNPLVEEAIKKATRDVPEVTQVRWVGFRSCWVTAADDDMIRLWGSDGVKLMQFNYAGGSVQCLYVDNVNKLLAAAMMDKSAYVYNLDDPIPRAEYKGHQDVIRAISYLQDSNCFVTASWDRSLRLWQRPLDKRHGDSFKGATDGASMNLLDLEEEGDEEHCVSNYEKLHPLEVPRALTEANQWQLLKAIGVLEDDKAGAKKKRNMLRDMQDTASDTAADVPGSLGARLEKLGKDLMTEIDSISKQPTRPPGGGGSSQEKRPPRQPTNKTVAKRGP